MNKLLHTRLAVNAEDWKAKAATVEASPTAMTIVDKIESLLKGITSDTEADGSLAEAELGTLTAALTAAREDDIIRRALLFACGSAKPTNRDVRFAVELLVSATGDTALYSMLATEMGDEDAEASAVTVQKILGCVSHLRGNTLLGRPCLEASPNSGPADGSAPPRQVPLTELSALTSLRGFLSSVGTGKGRTLVAVFSRLKQLLKLQNAAAFALDAHLANTAKNAEALKLSAQFVLAPIVPTWTDIVLVAFPRNASALHAIVVLEKQVLAAASDTALAQAEVTRDAVRACRDAGLSLSLGVGPDLQVGTLQVRSRLICVASSRVEKSDSLLICVDSDSLC